MPLNRWSDNILIAEFGDEPAFSEDIDALFRQLNDDEAPTPHVVVDMRGVTYLNSSNITQLLKLRKHLLSRDARLRVCSVNDAIWSVLLITGLDKLFDFTDDVSTSIASLQIELS